jgi:hypothetical protein
MPKFWVFLCRDWLQISHDLSWSWWRALDKSPWSACDELRTSVLHYDAHPYPGQRPEAERVQMSERIVPGQLMQVIEALVRQHLLLKRDAGQIEEALLKRVDRFGEWM